MDIIIKKEWGDVTLVEGKLIREFSEYHSTVNQNDIISILISNEKIRSDWKDITTIPRITLSEDQEYIKEIDKVISRWIYHIEFISGSHQSRYYKLSKEKFEQKLRDSKLDSILK